MTIRRVYQKNLFLKSFQLLLLSRFRSSGSELTVHFESRPREISQRMDKIIIRKIKKGTFRPFHRIGKL